MEEITLPLNYFPNVEEVKIDKFFMGAKMYYKQYYLGCHYTHKFGSGTCVLAKIPKEIAEWVKGKKPEFDNAKVNLVEFTITLTIKKPEHGKKI